VKIATDLSEHGRAVPDQTVKTQAPRLARKRMAGRLGFSAPLAEAIAENKAWKKIAVRISAVSNLR